MTRTEHNLPFSELSDRRFEQLCFALLRADGHTGVRHWGDAGSERGCDIVSIAPDGRRWATQAKRVQELGPTPAVAELTKVLDDPPDPEPDVYLLAASCALSRATEETLAAAITARGKTWDVECWGRTELDARVRACPEVRDRFFGELSRMRGPHWNVPNRNAFFTGREDLLAALTERLETAGATALSQTITGLGGVGKTQVAIEYCHRHRDRYDGGVFWADASSVASLQASYTSFAVVQGLARPEDPAEDAAERFRQLLSQEDGWLLVLDNADSPDEIRPLLPRAAAGHVIVTTRARVPGLGRDPLPVDLLGSEQATGFLLDRAHRDAEECASARELANALGCLPLALEQAGAYLARHPVPIMDYLEGFRQWRLALIESQAPEQGEGDVTLATTLGLSFRQVEEASPAAAEVMWACAFLAPDGIPLELFVFTGDRLGPALGALAEEAAEEPLTFHERLVEPLTRYSLAHFDSADSGQLSVHRLVQEVARKRLESEGRDTEMIERLHYALDDLFPRIPESPAAWPTGARWFPHVQAVLAAWQELEKKPSWDPTPLWMRAARFARAVAGIAASAQMIEEEVYSVSRRALGEERPSTLTSPNNPAEPLMAFGDPFRAREDHEEAPSVSKSSVPKVFISYSHDSEPHKERVLALANRLRADGVDVRLDQYNSAPRQGWPRWTRRQIKEADYVLVIATETYERRFDGEEAGTGRGATFEGAIVTQELYDAGLENVTFMPVVLATDDLPHVPVILRSFTSYNLASDTGYERLYRRLTHQPEIVAPPLGERKEKPPRRVEPLYADDATRELSQALKDAHRRRAEGASAGKDVAEVNAEIIDMTRRLREGGRLQAGDYLKGGRFELLEHIGQGGFASVWKAYDEVRGEMVAIKVLHGQYAQDRTRRERFFRGARHMAQLRHPGLVAVIETQCDEGGFHFFVMEYAGGGDLRQAVLDGRVSHEEGLKIILEVGEIIEHAHGNGLIHRDVKPANVLLDLERRPKLTDFDLVRALDSTGGTRTGMLGTFLYAAPEVMMMAKEAGRAADVYGLGMTALFVLHGADLPPEVLRETDSFITGLSVSEACRAVLLRAVAWKANERWGSVREFCRELREALEQGSALLRRKVKSPERTAIAQEIRERNYEDDGSY